MSSWVDPIPGLDFVQLPKYYTRTLNRVVLACGHRAGLWLHLHCLPSSALSQSFLLLPLCWRQGLCASSILELTLQISWDDSLPSQDLHRVWHGLLRSLHTLLFSLQRKLWKCCIIIQSCCPGFSLELSRAFVFCCHIQMVITHFEQN